MESLAAGHENRCCGCCLIRFEERTMAIAEGKITQIIGAVVDVAFPRESIPKVYDALKL